MPSSIPLRVLTPADDSVRASLPSQDTSLPHWGPVRRTVHRLCRRSRTLNTVVAALEMRLGREELLSLPQYMALCPTGQCNALCGFCSVTTNRTGIIKKQLPFDAISRLTGPVSRVIRMYGLEGNGEPTLYERFNDLAETLLRNGATAYLITNGDRLTPETIGNLVRRRLDAVNFSLNAATAATHRRIMKLRDFDRVLRNIRQFVQARGSAGRPTVSVSMVVTRDNVHEVVDFIRLAEQDLGVDNVLVRPLSEIATEHGAVEDLRPLVPFESEITDMLEGVRDYLASTPRQANVQIVPENFRAVRPDPPDTIPMPPDEEDRLFAPRPAYWTTAPGAFANWSWNAVDIRSPAASAGPILASAPIPVPSDANLVFRCEAAVPVGILTIAIGPPGGAALASATARGNETVEIAVPTGSHRVLAFHVDGDGPLDARLTFDRLRTPAAVRSTEFLLPHPGRWEITSPDIAVEWRQQTVRVTGVTRSGPYLLKSYSVACAPNTRLSLPLTVNVRSGALGAGVLSGDQQRWLDTRTFTPGATQAALSPETGDNARLYLVLYGASDGELDADVTWLSSAEAAPARLSGATHQEFQNAAPQLVVGEMAIGAIEADSQDSDRLDASGTGHGVESWRLRLGRAVRGEVRYYCQKPWTDLHNFTVDGRMDVCCIATGESQTRYALGNLLHQSFQDVWNGPQAKEFRRTVNSSAPLPPCRRCPMAYAYQGPLFNPAGAQRRIDKALARTVERLPFGTRLSAAARGIVRPVVSHVIFRGFKR